MNLLQCFLRHLGYCLKTMQSNLVLNKFFYFILSTHQLSKALLNTLNTVHVLLSSAAEKHLPHYWEITNLNLGNA